MSTIAYEHTSVDLKDAFRISGINPKALRAAERRGDIAFHYEGSKPLVLVRDLIDYVESLPTRPGGVR